MNPSVVDFQEGSGDPIVDLVANEFDFLALGDDYVEDVSKDVAGGMADVADGIVGVADGKSLSPNLGDRPDLLE